MKALLLVPVLVAALASVVSVVGCATSGDDGTASGGGQALSGSSSGTSGSSNGNVASATDDTHQLLHGEIDFHSDFTNDWAAAEGVELSLHCPASETTLVGKTDAQGFYNFIVPLLRDTCELKVTNGGKLCTVSGKDKSVGIFAGVGVSPEDSPTFVQKYRLVSATTDCSIQPPTNG